MEGNEVSGAEDVDDDGGDVAVGQGGEDDSKVLERGWREKFPFHSRDEFDEDVKGVGLEARRFAFVQGEDVICNCLWGEGNGSGSVGAGVVTLAGALPMGGPPGLGVSVGGESLSMEGRL